jgi:hypothetical protein
VGCAFFEGDGVGDGVVAIGVGVDESETLDTGGASSSGCSLCAFFELKNCCRVSCAFFEGGGVSGGVVAIGVGGACWEESTKPKNETSICRKQARPISATMRGGEKKRGGEKRGRKGGCCAVLIGEGKF